MIDRLLSIPEAASRLGVKEATIRKWRFLRTISVVRVGSRSIRIAESEIQRLIEEGCQPAIPPGSLKR